MKAVYMFCSLKVSSSHGTNSARSQVPIPGKRVPPAK